MVKIKVDQLSVTFTKGSEHVYALKNVSFSVGQGESFGIVGESGSGKSTVLRAICGLTHQKTGNIHLDDKVLKAPRNDHFYRHVQMVFQDPYASLHPRHTINRVLSEALTIHRFDHIDSRVKQALQDVGLDPSFRYRYPHQLSGGQRQRVAIARALILEPNVVLLDEPTSALDASIQAEVLNLLDRLRQARNLTYILVSHDLSVVSHMCDRLMVMKQGEVVEEMTQQDLSAFQAKEPYTQTLLSASLGYKKSATHL
jgi:peptide/nickel transport system ATP-binding protein